MQPASKAIPSALFPGLFEQFQLADDGPDMKAFVDAVPLAEPEVIMTEYRNEQPTSPAEVRAFVCKWFDLPEATVCSEVPERSPSLAEHVERLWPSLVRRDEEGGAEYSRIALPFPYLVPGGIFRESYYWDTYFTIVGLRYSHFELCKQSVRNLAYLIDEFGFVPNGNRTYYLTRSQPPVFFAALAALDEERPARAFAAYLAQLRREHAFWMSGETEVDPIEARRVVRLAGGEILNRYWDDGEGPRGEALRADLALSASVADRPATELFRDIRAACESGWDFSSRWFADGVTMETIMTTSIVPADLNALLFGLECAIRLGAEELGNVPLASEFKDRATARSEAMNRYLWNNTAGYFDDYDLSAGRQRASMTPACLFPLFCGLASPLQAHRTADLMERTLLAPGGLLTSTQATGQQWDSPNGWAPLQWIAVEGFERYGCSRLAREIAGRWLDTVNRVFRDTGRIVEKYDVVNPGRGGGGEYPLQDGFGWTNGVTIALLRRYPDLTPKP